jgi:hypothetical protein
MCLAILLAARALPAPADTPAQAGKPQITSPSELPPHAYVIQGKPSQVVQNHEAVLALAVQVEKDLTGDLERYDIRDNSVLQRIYVDLSWVDMLKRDHAEARRHLELVRGLQASPSGRLLTGVITVPIMEAVDHPGADFHATFRGLLSKGLAVLPREDVQGPLRAMRDSMASVSEAQIVRSVEAGLDPAVQDGKISREVAEGIVSAAVKAEVILPVKDDVVASLGAFFAAQGTTAADSAGKCPQTVSPTLPDGPYFGQEAPDGEPRVFAPGIVSLPDRREMKVAFSPDGRECLIGIGDGSTFKLLYTALRDGHWSPATPADFVTTPRAQEPFFSPDGRKIFFTSYADIYVSTRKDTSWTAPVKLGPPVNTAAEEYHPTVTSNGTLYFCSMRDNPNGDIFRSRLVDGGYATVEKLDATINSHSSLQDGAYDPCIAPDESYLIFTSVRSDGRGKGDFYISYRSADGSWTQPTSVGPAVNTAGEEYGAYVGPDQKTFFFARPSGWGPSGPADVYWVRADFLDALRPKSSS